MPRSPRSPLPPEWWNLSLYEYLTEEIPLAGWIWEFMRRDRLKMLRPNQPADVMNPNLDTRTMPGHMFPYYLPWPFWAVTGPVLDVPSAVRWEGVTPPLFFRHAYYDLARYELEDYSLASDPLPSDQWVDIRINLSRSNPVIVRDLETALKKARGIYPKPTRITPKPQNWKDNRILEVWDLREFDVSWMQIAKLSGMATNKDDEHPSYEENLKQSVRNAYNTAERLIQEKGWQDCALQINDRSLQE
jgi:hypothetical protein